MTQPSKRVWYGIAVIIGLILIQKLFILYTDYLWFGALDQGPIFMTILKSRILLALLFGIPFFVWLYGNARLARRPLPKDVTLIGRRLLPEEERQQIEQYADRAIFIFCLIGALMVAAVAAAQWREWLQFLNAVPFSSAGLHNDPLFDKDAGFYVFKLSFILYLWRSVFYAIVIALVVSVLVHLYQEAIRIVGNVVHAIPRARIHVLSLLALAFFAKIYSYRLMQYSLVYSTHGKVFFGASYADVHARLPLMMVLMIMCGLAGIACLLSFRGRSLTVPGGALAAVLLVSILGGWAYPLSIQKLVVGPNELERERPFIEYNIKATNLAYKTADVVDKPHAVTSDLNWDDINDNAATIYNIRLWDHRPLETSYQQMQALRQYYQFADVDVDRYEINGEVRQVMLSARQLAYDRLSPTWVNRHLLYTHGYGLTMSPVAEVTKKGQPVYWIKDLPPVSPIGLHVKRPALYYTASWHPRLIERIAPPEFIRDEAQERAAARPLEEPEGAPGQPGAGQGTPQPRPAAGQWHGTDAGSVPLFVLGNTKANELDYPQVSDEEGEANAYTHYSGTGGVQLTGIWRKLAFAIRFSLSRHYQILFTDSITPESRLMMYRELPERLTALAPFLMYDPDPYLMVDDAGELKWICDAYTVSNMYPYSARITWSGNYVRNSVKVVVDAYEGRPQYYIVDPQDPMVQCYQKIFPTLFRDFSQMEASVKDHLRYPQLLFRIQAGIYAKYHQKNPQTFYQAEDEWAVPPEVYADSYREVEAYYQVMKLPGEEKEEFLLMLPLVLAKFERRNMVAWMAARCDAENYGELVVYRFPKKQLVFGPMQFEAFVDNDPELSELMTLWGQSGSQVIRGNVLAIPVADTLLYVEPIYLESTDSPIPELRLVVLMHGDKLVQAPTLDKALAKLLGRDGVRKRPAPGVEPPAEPAEVTAPAAAVAVSADELATLRSLLKQVIEMDKEAEAYLTQGDLGKYRDKQQEQGDLLEKAWQELEQ